MDDNQRIVDTTVIMITGYATMNTAIESMKLGAHDYIAKPFDINRVSSLIQETLKTA